jgi:hypothetical protein
MNEKWNSRAIDGRALAASWLIAAVGLLALSLVPNRAPNDTPALAALAPAANYATAALAHPRSAGIDHDCDTCSAREDADQRC